MQAVLSDQNMSWFELHSAAPLFALNFNYNSMIHNPDISRVKTITFIVPSIVTEAGRYTKTMDLEKF